MARHPNPKNKFTTISIRKDDKIRIRQLAGIVKETKNGVVYDKDADIISNILDVHFNNNPQLRDRIPKPTYPANVHEHNQDKSRQD